MLSMFENSQFSQTFAGLVGLLSMGRTFYVYSHTFFVAGEFNQH